MKLARLQLVERYRSLEPFEQSFPKPSFVQNEIDPICLVGLNGSGKSNFLELIADIFYYLDTLFLKYNVTPKPYTPYSDNKKRNTLYFEIDYKIIKKTVEYEVRILRRKIEKKDNLLFFIKENNQYVDISFEQGRDYLPRIIAYTSGSNELLSMPFIELQDYYAREVTYRVNQKKRNDNETGNSEVIISEPSLTLMDYDSNAAIVVANFLLNDINSVGVFEENTRIKALDSFRIVIRLNKGYNTNKIDLPNEFENYIKKLLICSTCYKIEYDDKRGNVYYLDYLVNDFTKSLFKKEFTSPQELFTALNKLNLLNTFSVQKEYRNALRKKRENGILLKFPTIASLDKIFSIDQIELILSKPSVRTEYMKISDGEHQFIHIVGGMLLFDNENNQDILYLFDEPDTHFNPQWRSKFFSQINQTLKYKDHELIITTHSPFILSDCHGYNVFKFKRDENGEVVHFSRIDAETYGASFSNILKNAFEFDTLISEKSYLDLESLKDKDATNVDQRIKLFGDSVEKLFILKEIEENEKPKL